MNKTFPETKFKRNDVVTFVFQDKAYVGVVYIVDRYGTTEQHEEPSYDIYAFQENGDICLYKHFRQSLVKRFEGKKEDSIDILRAVVQMHVRRYALALSKKYE